MSVGRRSAGRLGPTMLGLRSGGSRAGPVLNCSLWVANRPWGAPGYTFRVASLTSSTDRRAEASMGTIWSSSPWMVRVGTSIRLRSSVKSVSEKALTLIAVGGGQAHVHVLAGQVAGPVRRLQDRVRALADSSRTAATWAARQVSRPSTAAGAMGRRSCGSPGSPKSWLVLVEQPDPPHPLGALPEVQVGHQQPRRPPSSRSAARRSRW